MIEKKEIAIRLDSFQNTYKDYLVNVENSQWLLKRQPWFIVVPMQRVINKDKNTVITDGYNFCFGIHGLMIADKENDRYVSYLELTDNRPVNALYTKNNLPATGITDGLEIKVGGTGGAIRFLSFRFKVYDKNVFNLFETIYLVYGGGLRVQYGWSYDYTGQLVVPIPPSEFLNENVTGTDFNKMIEQYKLKYNGAIDGGDYIINKFNWSQGNDGIYEVSIEATTASYVSFFSNTSDGTSITNVAQQGQAQDNKDKDITTETTAYIDYAIKYATEKKYACIRITPDVSTITNNAEGTYISNEIIGKYNDDYIDPSGLRFVVTEGSKTLVNNKNGIKIGYLINIINNEGDEQLTPFISLGSIIAFCVNTRFMRAKEEKQGYVFNYITGKRDLVDGIDVTKPIIVPYFKGLLSNDPHRVILLQEALNLKYLKEKAQNKNNLIYTIINNEYKDYLEFKCGDSKTEMTIADNMYNSIVRAQQEIIKKILNINDANNFIDLRSVLINFTEFKKILSNSKTVDDILTSLFSLIQECYSDVYRLSVNKNGEIFDVNSNDNDNKKNVLNETNTNPTLYITPEIVNGKVNAGTAVRDVKFTNDTSDLQSANAIYGSLQEKEKGTTTSYIGYSLYGLFIENKVLNRNMLVGEENVTLNKEKYDDEIEKYEKLLEDLIRWRYISVEDLESEEKLQKALEKTKEYEKIPSNMLDNASRSEDVKKIQKEVEAKYAWIKNTTIVRKVMQKLWEKTGIENLILYTYGAYRISGKSGWLFGLIGSRDEKREIFREKLKNTMLQYRNKTFSEQLLDNKNKEQEMTKKVFRPAMYIKLNITMDAFTLIEPGLRVEINQLPSFLSGYVDYFVGYDGFRYKITDTEFTMEFPMIMTPKLNNSNLQSSEERVTSSQSTLVNDNKIKENMATNSWKHTNIKNGRTAYLTIDNLDNKDTNNREKMRKFLDSGGTFEDLRLKLEDVENNIRTLPFEHNLSEALKFCVYDVSKVFDGKKIQLYPIPLPIFPKNDNKYKSLIEQFKKHGCIFEGEKYYYLVYKYPNESNKIENQQLPVILTGNRRYLHMYNNKIALLSENYKNRLEKIIFDIVVIGYQRYGIVLTPTTLSSFFSSTFRSVADQADVIVDKLTGNNANLVGPAGTFRSHETGNGIDVNTKMLVNYSITEISTKKKSNLLEFFDEIFFKYGLYRPWWTTSTEIAKKYAPNPQQKDDPHYQLYKS